MTNEINELLQKFNKISRTNKILFVGLLFAICYNLGLKPNISFTSDKKVKKALSAKEAVGTNKLKLVENLKKERSNKKLKVTKKNKSRNSKYASKSPRLNIKKYKNKDYSNTKIYDGVTGLAGLSRTYEEDVNEEEMEEIFHNEEVNTVQIEKEDVLERLSME